MARRYSGSGWSGAQWAAHHRQRRQELTRRFGGIDEDVERIFLGLDTVRLRALLRDYAERHGDSAAAYARSAYPKWKTGPVLLSGQTAERLLDLLPPYLSGEARYELIRKLRLNCLGKLALNVKCEPTKLADLLRRNERRRRSGERISYSIINEISFIVVNALVWAAIAVAVVLTRRPLSFQRASPSMHHWTMS